MSDFEPIRITGVIAESVTKPRNDGTPGSALYNVPFKLSRRPPAEWAQHFPEAWDHPSSSSSMHRPGICTVSGDTVWLNGTTIEEVEKTHQQTLKLAVDETNRKYVEFDARRTADAAKKQKEADAHAAHVREATKKIKFE